MRQTDVTFDEMLSDISKEWHSPLHPIPSRDALIDARERAAAVKREAAAQRVRRSRARRAAGLLCLKDVWCHENIIDLLIELHLLLACDADDADKVAEAAGKLLDRLRLADFDPDMLRVTSSGDENV